MKDRAMVYIVILSASKDDDLQKKNTILAYFLHLKNDRNVQFFNDALKLSISC